MQIAIIPARGGSKGVPGKNLKMLAGKPLIAYTIEAAQESNCFNDIFVSTDDKQIALLANSYGIKIPFLRPADLSNDDTPMLSVIKHIICFYQSEGKKLQTIVLLQTTYPFRTAKDIIGAVHNFAENDYDSIISVQEVPDKYNPNWTYIKKDDTLQLFNGDVQPISRRQDLPQAFIREGSIYIFRAATIEKYDNIYGERIGFYLIRRKTVNIDTMDDFIEAERLMGLQKEAKEI